jgi:putative peptidoglycan lipid II flippase
MIETYRYSLKLALFVATPAMIALVVLAEPVVAVIYQRGLFTHAETLKTAAALRFAALGICSVALVRQTVPVFYAMENSRVPMMMTFVFVAVHATSGFILKGPFLHVGLCMALSLAATVQGMGLLVMLRHSLGQLGLASVALSFLRSLLLTVPMGLTVVGLTRLGAWREGGNSPANIALLLAAVALGAAVYGLFAYLIKAPELTSLLSAFKKRRRDR